MTKARPCDQPQLIVARSHSRPTAPWDGASRCGHARSGGVTRRARVREDGSLRVRFPGPPAAELEAVIVNTAGGMAGGDRFISTSRSAAGARLARHDRGGGEDLSLARARRRAST